MKNVKTVENRSTEARRLYIEEGASVRTIAVAFRTSDKAVRRALGGISAEDKQRHLVKNIDVHLGLKRWARNRQSKYGENARTSKRKVLRGYRQGLRAGYAAQEEAERIASRRRNQSPPGNDFGENLW